MVESQLDALTALHCIPYRIQLLFGLTCVVWGNLGVQGSGCGLQIQMSEV